MNIKTIYGGFLTLMSKLMGIDNAKKFDTWLRFHRKLNLKNPTTLADKVSYIELHDQSPLAAKCTDKAEVRKFVAEHGFEEILVPLIMEPVSSVEQIDFDKLPDTFVFKATHGCRMNYVVKDKNKIDKVDCKRVINKWLKTTYGTYSLEPHYLSIPPRVYAEKYIEDMEGLIDYKLHCFNGEPKFFMVCTGRNDKAGQSMEVFFSLFDTEWNFIDEIVGYKNEKKGPSDIPKPKTLDKMIHIAKELSKDFKFVRVDMYEVEEKVLFGELTFSPACCVFPYFSKQFVAQMGELLKI
jgi:hypothetical protein